MARSCFRLLDGVALTADLLPVVSSSSGAVKQSAVRMQVATSTPTPALSPVRRRSLRAHEALVHSLQAPKPHDGGAPRPPLEPPLASRAWPKELVARWYADGGVLTTAAVEWIAARRFGGGAEAGDGLYAAGRAAPDADADFTYAQCRALIDDVGDGLPERRLQRHAFFAGAGNTGADAGADAGLLGALRRGDGDAARALSSLAATLVRNPYQG